jgi:hypothetical protein
MPLISGEPERGTRPERPRYAFPPVTQVLLSIGWNIRIAPEEFDRVDAILAPDWTRTPDDAGSLRHWESVLRDRSVTLVVHADQCQLHVHWDGSAGDRYPHYEPLRDCLLQTWERLSVGWQRPELMQLPVIHWMVDYHNRIPQGTVWHHEQEVTFCRWVQTPLPLIAGEVPVWLKHTWSFESSTDPAMLLVTLEGPELADDAQDQAFQLELMVTGHEPVSADEIAAHLDAARQRIVTTFPEMMTREANAYWGLEAT